MIHHIPDRQLDRVGIAADARRRGVPVDVEGPNGYLIPRDHPSRFAVTPDQMIATVECMERYETKAYNLPAEEADQAEPDDAEAAQPDEPVPSDEPTADLETQASA